MRSRLSCTPVRSQHRSYGKSSRAFRFAAAYRFDAFADQARAAIDHAGVELHEAGARGELRGRVIAIRDAAYADQGDLPIYAFREPCQDSRCLIKHRFTG